MQNGEPRPEPNLPAIHIELRRRGVTLRLLHEEYVAGNPNAYGYTKYVELYNAWAERLRVTMRQVHKAGEKCFVDYWVRSRASSTRRPANASRSSSPSR
jgi:transposase